MLNKPNTTDLRSFADGVLKKYGLPAGIDVGRTSIDDEKCWETAYSEYESEQLRRKGLWVKLLVEFNEDKQKVKIAYIKIRAAQLLAEHVENLRCAIEKMVKEISDRVAADEMASRASEKQMEAEVAKPFKMMAKPFLEVLKRNGYEVVKEEISVQRQSWALSTIKDGAIFTLDSVDELKAFAELFMH